MSILQLEIIVAGGSRIDDLSRYSSGELRLLQQDLENINVKFPQPQDTFRYIHLILHPLSDGILDSHQREYQIYDSTYRKVGEALFRGSLISRKEYRFSP